MRTRLSFGLGHRGLGPLGLGSLGLVIALAAAASVAACESGPSGPGSVEATVESPRRIAGGVVVEVRGAGIRGFTAASPLQLFWAPQSEPGAFRVVLINPGDAAPLTFQIQVDDLGADPPTGQVIEATALTNLPLADASDFGFMITP